MVMRRGKEKDFWKPKNSLGSFLFLKQLRDAGCSRSDCHSKKQMAWGSGTSAPISNETNHSGCKGLPVKCAPFVSNELLSEPRSLFAEVESFKSVQTSTHIDLRPAERKRNGVGLMK